MDTIRILNVDILQITQKDLLAGLDRGVLITPNVDHLVKLQRDAGFYDVYREAEWVVCDSKILYLLSKLLRRPLPEAIPGSSFFTAYYMHHKDDADCRIFLLGAKEGIAAKAMERINVKVGRRIVVGAHSPSFGFEKNEQECEDIIDIVNKSGANVLLVGVGAPKQEKWIVENHANLNAHITCGIGAVFDFYAGTKNRPPQWMINLGLEWFGRLISDPKRLWCRYIIYNPVFVWKILKLKRRS